MRRRSLIMFVLLNVLITAAVIFAVTTFLNSNAPPPSTSQLVITVPILVTATIDPNAGPAIKIVTATPQPGTVILPTGILSTPGTATSSESIGTIDANALAVNPADAQSVGAAATVLPENCILHTLVDGDTPFAVAEQYGGDPFRLMEVNGLNDETASLLQIGDVLIVPLEGCPLTGPVTTPVPTLEETSETAEGTAEVTAEATEELATATATLRPTLTLPPTATNAMVEIAEVIGVGQIASEGITIRNNGNNVNLQGWTIETSGGNVYTFTERILFSNGLVTVYSRVGQDTAIALFWNRTQPGFQPGDVVTLKDNTGKVQGSYRLPAPVTLP